MIHTDELQDESVPAPILADIPWIVTPDGTFVGKLSAVRMLIENVQMSN